MATPVLQEMDGGSFPGYVTDEGDIVDHRDDYLAKMGIGCRPPVISVHLSESALLIPSQN